MGKKKMCHNHEEEICECGGHLSRFIEPRLLILLRQKEAHGYELIERMNDFPFSDVTPDAGAVYKTLRAMEEEGLVKSKWDTKESGPARRIYRITKEGEDRLYGWVVSLRKRKEAIEKFLETYERK